MNSFMKKFLMNSFMKKILMNSFMKKEEEEESKTGDKKNKKKATKQTMIPSLDNHCSPINDHHHHQATGLFSRFSCS